MKKWLYLLVLLVAFSACKKDKEVIIDEQPVITSSTDTVAIGDFVSDAHPTSGKVFILRDTISGNLTMFFQNFSTDPGPSLQVWLSKVPTAPSVTDYLDYGGLTATAGNLLYDIDDTADLSMYKYVLIWCEPFSVRFGYAELMLVP